MQRMDSFAFSFLFLGRSRFAAIHWIFSIGVSIYTRGWQIDLLR